MTQPLSSISMSLQCCWLARAVSDLQATESELLLLLPLLLVWSCVCVCAQPMLGFFLLNFGRYV